MYHHQRLGVVEAKFADIVWQHAPLPTAQLVKLCQQELNWARTTTYTVLKRLSERGLFQNVNGTVDVLITRDDFYAMQSEMFLEETFDGSLPAFLVAFSSRKKLTAEEVAQIRRMIDRYEEG